MLHQQITFGGRPPLTLTHNDVSGSVYGCHVSCIAALASRHHNSTQSTCLPIHADKEMYLDRDTLKFPGGKPPDPSTYGAIPYHVSPKHIPAS